MGNAIGSFASGILLVAVQFAASAPVAASDAQLYLTNDLKKGYVEKAAPASTDAGKVAFHDCAEHDPSKIVWIDPGELTAIEGRCAAGGGIWAGTLSAFTATSVQIRTPENGDVTVPLGEWTKAFGKAREKWPTPGAAIGGLSAANPKGLFAIAPNIGGASN
jgi:hypothetical protein